MELYEAINKRRTVRDFLAADVPTETVQRIIDAGLKAPTNDHRRNWEFVLLHTPQEKKNALGFVKAWAEAQKEAKLKGDDGIVRQMYAYAMPRQYTMLFDAPWVIMPFFRAGGSILKPTAINSLNPFASIWCVIENIFLAATAEGLGCAIRIPVGDEGVQAAKAVGAPDDYMLPCYIGLGHPADAAALAQNEYTFEDKAHFGRW